MITVIISEQPYKRPQTALDVAAGITGRRFDPTVLHFYPERDMSRMGLESYAETVCSFEESLVVTDSDLLLNWFRVAVKRGVIKPERLWIFMVPKAGNASALPLDDDGRVIVSVVPLFMDEWRRSLRELL